MAAQGTSPCCAAAARRPAPNIRDLEKLLKEQAVALKSGDFSVDPFIIKILQKVVGKKMTVFRGSRRARSMHKSFIRPWLWEMFGGRICKLPLTSAFPSSAVLLRNAGPLRVLRVKLEPMSSAALLGPKLKGGISVAVASGGAGLPPAELAAAATPDSVRRRQLTSSEGSEPQVSPTGVTRQWAPSQSGLSPSGEEPAVFSRRPTCLLSVCTVRFDSGLVPANPDQLSTTLLSFNKV